MISFQHITFFFNCYFNQELPIIGNSSLRWFSSWGTEMCDVSLEKDVPSLNFNLDHGI